MPFENLSAGSGQDYFSRGFVDDLITDLSRFSNLAVLAAHSTSSERAADLRPDFLLTGSLRRARDRLRVTAELLDGTTSSVVWAERFDKQADDIFAIQDEISAKVVRDDGAIGCEGHCQFLGADVRARNMLRLARKRGPSWLDTSTTP